MTTMANPYLHGLLIGLRERREAALAAALLICLLVVNVSLNPNWLVPSNWGGVIGLASPLLLASMAAMPSILSGRGGIDVSVGPAMGFVNVVIVQSLFQGAGLETPFIVVPAALALGIAVGSLNGVLALFLRIQPIVATLGSYLFLSGITLTIVPAPTGTIPDWLRELANGYAILPLAFAVVVWIAVKSLPFHSALMTVGSDDRAAYTAGLPVTTIRFLAYGLGGLFAGLAGLSLTALIGSADPNIGPNFTLSAISAIALGGISLAGGRGGCLAALLGAIDIFLLQSALTYFNLSPFVLQIAYGMILVLSVSLNAIFAQLSRRSRGMA